MADPQEAKTQLDKIREMRKELGRINNTLARMEMLVDQAIRRYHLNPSAQKGFGNDSTPHLATTSELPALEGWMKSIVESYVAILATIGIERVRMMAGDLSRFVNEQTKKHESANTLRYTRIVNESVKR